MKSGREQPVRIIIKRKGRHAKHHGGAWKVAFADFMTSMMALFLVLWLITQSSDVKSAIAGYFQDPLGRASEFGSSILPGEGAQASNVRPITQTQIVDLSRDRLMVLGERLRREIKTAPEFHELSDHVEIEMAADGLRISLLEDSNAVFFESGSSRPRPSVEVLLRAMGKSLADAPHDVVLEGHTDARPWSGPRAYSNWELSADRANAARRLLVEGGLSEQRVVEVRGYADRAPRDSADPYAAVNRRVTILLVQSAAGPVTAVIDSVRAGASGDGG
jgi:chemotaxis protein MotB